MKAYTDLEQSKKLAEILPIESADMHYPYVLPKSDRIKHNPEIGNPVNALKWYNKGYTTSGKEPITLDEYCVPCWSLAALLEVIREKVGYDLSVWDMGYSIEVYDLESGKVIPELYSNPVDAAIETIYKLKEKDLL